MNVIIQNTVHIIVKKAGFANVTPINDKLLWHDLRFIRTGGQHGTGEIGQLIYVVHLESVNHSSESRSVIKTAISINHFSERCFVPEDGSGLFE